MGDGNNRLHQFLDIRLEVSREAATLAWLAMAAKGKQKGKDLQAMSRIREAILADQTVNEESCSKCGATPGNVVWSDAVITFRNEDDFTVFAKAVDKMTDDDGVDFSLSTAALELQAKATALRDEIKAAMKSRDAVKPQAPASA